MDRVWGVSLFAGMFITGWLAAAWFKFLAPLPPLPNAFAIGGAVILFAFTVFALFARNMGSIQARQDHIRISTPFLRLKIGYKRIKAVRPAVFGALFPPESSGWGTRHFLEPYYPKTALVIELSSLPLSRSFLKLFLSPQMFQPRTNNLIFLVDDWMALSTEIESRRHSSKQTYTTQKPGGFGLMRDISKK
jgi:hypothetical protein